MTPCLYLQRLLAMAEQSFAWRRYLRRMVGLPWWASHARFKERLVAYGGEAS